MGRLAESVESSLRYLQPVLGGRRGAPVHIVSPGHLPDHLHIRVVIQTSAHCVCVLMSLASTEEVCSSSGRRLQRRRRWHSNTRKVGESENSKAMSKRSYNGFSTFSPGTGSMAELTGGRLQKRTSTKFLKYSYFLYIYKGAGAAPLRMRCLTYRLRETW